MLINTDVRSLWAFHYDDLTLCWCIRLLKKNYVMLFFLLPPPNKTKIIMWEERQHWHLHFHLSPCMDATFLVLQQCTCWRNTANKWWINKKTLPHSSFSPSTCTFCYHKRCWLQIKANAFFLSYHFCHRPSLWNSSHNRKPFLSFLVH